jgi:RNA polymerase sigma-70 factor, ECF subfamily
LCDVPHLLPPLEEDEYVLDTPLVRDAVAEVRARIAAWTLHQQVVVTAANQNGSLHLESSHDGGRRVDSRDRPRARLPIHFTAVGVDDSMAPDADEPEHDVRSALDVVADSDGELLCRIAERDLAALEILYRRYARSVYGLALRRLRDREGAEDATRRAFAAIWRSAGTYVPEGGSGEQWLFTVAQNAIVDHAPAPSRTPLVASAELPEVTPRESGPESVAEDDWLAFRVHAAVAELPEQERVTLELAYWGGRSRSEIAELLGLPLGTVTIRTRSALAHLAVRLEGLG